MLMIKPGVLPPPKRFLFKCTNCGCEWIADETELVRHYTDDEIHYFGDSACPTCDNIIACLREVSPEECDKMCEQVDEWKLGNRGVI